ncbi:MAG: hypothetical protein ACREEC_04300, partial [Thermoplasmata archaeon]
VYIGVIDGVLQTSGADPDFTLRDRMEKLAAEWESGESGTGHWPGVYASFARRLRELLGGKP